MQIKQLNPNFLMPTKGTKGAGAFDIYMPEPGSCSGDFPTIVPLGFSAAIPLGHAAILIPRSGAGFKHGVELNNTCGLIDSDFRGEWHAAIKTKSGAEFNWNQGDRVLQFIVVPIPDIQLELVFELDDTDRGNGGFGSTGT